MGSITDLLDSARHEVWIKLYEFTADQILEAAIRAIQRGVKFRVMLNEVRSNDLRVNDRTYEALESAGAQVAWTNPDFLLTHEKTLLVDRTTLLTATFNYSEKYFHQTRDFGIILDDEQVIMEVMACFEADWHRRDYVPPANAPIAFSPENSRKVFCNFIDSAERSLAIQHMKLADDVILDHLLAAIDRGVAIRILCGGRHGLHAYDMPSTLSLLRILKRAGADVRKQKNLRLHAKVLIADDSRLLIGSTNVDINGFDSRREISYVLTDADLAQSLLKVYDYDWSLSKVYDPPDPLDRITLERPDSDFPHDPDFYHD